MAGMIGTLLPQAASGNDTSGPPIPQGALGGMLTQQSEPSRPNPAPSYPQVMAAMHRFTAIRKVLTPLLKDPKLGREDVRDKVLDAAATLISQRVLTVAEAMNEVSKKMPTQPADQQLWLKKLVQNTMLAQDKVMDDYHASGQNWKNDEANTELKFKPDSYGEHMQGLMKHYGP